MAQVEKQLAWPLRGTRIPEDHFQALMRVCLDADRATNFEVRR
jgi:hypothetical protein